MKDAEFLASATDVINHLEKEVRRVKPEESARWRALEIGCGPGRLRRPLSRHFAEIHGVDVSDEMIRLAERKLVNVPNAMPRVTEGTDLAIYPDEFFDFVYSFAVFQHIPRRDPVFSYLTESRRVLKPGGILRFQVNGLPERTNHYTTWDGVHISAAEIAEFACAHDFQLLALEGVDTHYLWVTLRKQPSGWFAGLAENRPPSAARIRSICNMDSGEPIVPASGG